MSELSTSKAKERAKERDGYECRFCSVTREQHKEEYGRDVHAHHIIKDGNGGSDSVANLITVCRSCHNTLENTQAKALDRIRTEHTKDLEQQVAALESELEETRETIEALQESMPETPLPVYAWLDDTWIEINVLVTGGFDPTVATYQTREKAVEAYLEHDGAVKLMTSSINIGDYFSESARVASVGDVELYTTGYSFSKDTDIESVEPTDDETLLSEMEMALEASDA